MIKNALFSLLAVALLLVTLSGCGYAAKEVYPTEVRSVAVPIFENRTFYQGVEFDLTEALIKEIEVRTPYKVIKQGAADTTLIGSIHMIDLNSLSRRSKGGGMPQEVEFRMLIDFEWKNLRTGKILRQRSNFESVGRFVPVRPMGQTLSLGQHQACQNMAKAITSVMRDDF